MNSMKKARPAGDAAERAEAKNNRADIFLHCDSITGCTATQGRVEAVLLQGAENGLSAADLVSILELKDSRVLRQMVESERANGSLILSGDCGYFLPSPGEAGRQEIRDFVARMESQAWSLHKATGPARKALETLDGQFSLIDAINEGGMKWD